MVVRGKVSTMTSRRGRLNDAMRARQCASIAAGSMSRPARGTTNATTASSPASLRSPTTADLEHVGVLDEDGLDLGG